MAFAITHFFPGGTKAQYDATVKAVHPADGSLPAGQSFHAAGSSPGGFTIFAVHDSKAGWEKFRDESLVPKMQAGIAGGFTTPPEETEIEITNVQP
jgi:hypothetical protein